MAVIPTPVPTPTNVLGASTRTQYTTPKPKAYKFIGPILPERIGPPYTPSTTKQINNIPYGRSAPASGIEPSYPAFEGQSPQDSGEIDMINNEFNAFNSLLDQQASQANANFTETQGMYDTQKANAQKQYSTEKEQQIGGIKSTEALNLQKVRQLLGELTQRDAARSSMMGGGGSVAEALAERFGRTAQQGLKGVMDASSQAIERVNTFYNTAITKLQESYDMSVMQARQALQENLQNIAMARQQSAAAKQQNTISAWKEYYNNVNQQKIQAAQFKAQYDMWKQQQDSALGATQGFNLANANTYNTQSQGAIDSLQNTPNVSNPVTDQFNTGRNAYQVINRTNNQDDENWWEQNPGLLPALNAVKGY